jgi:predicted esterase
MLDGYNDPHKSESLFYGGADLNTAASAMILLHGRGATPDDILRLGRNFEQPDLAFVAPKAANYTWYPYSFLTDVEKNEPHLSSALEKVRAVMAQLKNQGFQQDQIYLLGFSQGACLALEYVAKNPGKYAGVFGLSGGLIGSTLDKENYSGDLESTPIFIGCSDADRHIPLERVVKSAEILNAMNAQVEKRIYPGMPHTVNDDEIEFIQQSLQAGAD